MPIYEYRCSSCGHQQEFLQKLSDPPVTVCTACGKPTFSKMLTAAGFQLKGSGWYATDFKDKPVAKAKSPAGGEAAGEAKSESRSESKAEAKSEGKAESKSEAKSESKAEVKPPAAPKSDGGKAAT
jgi:putative FmdB family regulatory protein